MRLDDPGHAEQEGLAQRGRQHLHPTGSPSSPVPKGTDTAGWPERFDGMVQTSFMYMAIGSSTFAPRSKAVVGAVAPSRTSKDS